jgi:hypothetical protein
VPLSFGVLLLPIVRVVLVVTSGGRDLSVGDVYRRWVVIAVLTAVPMLVLCFFFLYSFRTRLKILEKLTLFLIAIAATMLLSSYFVSIDPASSAVVGDVPMYWQLLLLLSALVLSFAFLLVFGLFVDRKPRTIVVGKQC